MVKKSIREFELRNVSPDDFINQAKGLKLVKQRKRQEKKCSNELKFESRTKRIHFNMPIIHKTPQIQRGFDIATKWRNENVDKLIV